MDDQDSVEEEVESEEGLETEAAPAAKDFISRLNPDSLKVMKGLAEPVIADAKTGERFQFLRVGYFCKDPDSTGELAVYNRVVPLKDSWAKQKNA